jgi:uncharacterized protein (TIGR03083 family)
MDTAVRSYVDKGEATAALRKCFVNLVTAIRTASDPNAIAVGRWSIRDVAVHLGDALQVHGELMRGSPGPIDSVELIGEVNQKLIDENPERDLNRLADRLEDIALPYMDELDRTDDRIVQWAGHHVPVSTLVAADLGECMVHGFDIAQAEGRKFPIDPHHAALAGRGVSPMARHYANPTTTRDLEAVFRLTLRKEWTLDFIFDHGTLSIEEPDGRKADVRISAEPVAFLLTGYGRIPIWKPIVQGKLMSWGRKPLLALKFQTLLQNP